MNLQMHQPNTITTPRTLRRIPAPPAGERGHRLGRALLAVALGVPLGLGVLPRQSHPTGAGALATLSRRAQAAGGAVTSTPALSGRFGQLPLAFEPNVGQAAPPVRFLARGAGYTVFLTATGATLALSPASAAPLWPGTRQAIPLPQPASRPARATRAALLPTLAGPAHTGGTPMADRAQPQAQGQRQDGAGAMVTLRLVGANPHARLVGLQRLPGVVNYYLGNRPGAWHTGIPTYARVAYRDVLPGTSLVYYSVGGQLEYDVVLAPGADPGRVRLAVEGAHGLALDRAGNLVLRLGGQAGAALMQAAPVVYQVRQGRRQPVVARYALVGQGQVGVRVGAHDASAPLVIDPVLRLVRPLHPGHGSGSAAGTPGLVYSTYLGGNDGDSKGRGIAVDHAGNAYVTGWTPSYDFPTKNAFQAHYPGAHSASSGRDSAFVTELSATGALVYSTYLGGSNYDVGHGAAAYETYGLGIALDGTGDVYVTGLTGSNDFPTKHALQPHYGGGEYYGDAFVTKLSTTGGLVYSTYLGSGSDDWGNGIAVDKSDNAYVTGHTYGYAPTKNALQHSGSIFITKLSAADKLVYSTYLGENNDTDEGTSIAVDSSGNTYVTGETYSASLPTKNALQPRFTSRSDPDAFVAKLSMVGQLVYSTYLGGSDESRGAGIAVDSTGNAYVTGYTYSKNFPTRNALQPRSDGGLDAFVTKLSATGRLVYSTYLGHGAEGSGIAVDGTGNAYITGSTVGNFPIKNALQKRYGGSGASSDILALGDVFVTKLSATDRLAYSTYLGGRDSEGGAGIAVDGAGDIYITGDTWSGNFPTKKALRRRYGGGGAAFVAKISAPAAASSPQAAATSPATPGPTYVTLPALSSPTAARSTRGTARPTATATPAP